MRRLVRGFLLAAIGGASLLGANDAFADGGKKWRGSSRRSVPEVCDERRPYSGRHSHRDCACEVRRLPERTEWRMVEVRSPGHYREVWVPPRYSVRRVFGVEVRICVSPGRHERVWHAGEVRYERRLVRVHAESIRTVPCRLHRG